MRGGVGYTMVWVAPSTISGFGPLFVEVCGGPEEGFEVHVVGHGILFFSLRVFLFICARLLVRPERYRSSVRRHLDGEIFCLFFLY